MTCYIVTFQTQTEASRLKVQERLQTYTSYCPIHNYCWAILSDKTATEIRDDLMEVIAQGERIFVIRSGTVAAWSSTYGSKNSEWLKENL